MAHTITLTAGAEIKIGQLLTAEMTDKDTSEPLTLAYAAPYSPDKPVIGIAMGNAKPWEKVVVAVQGSFTVDMTLFAGEYPSVYMTQPDSPPRIVIPDKAQPIIRYVIAVSDLTWGHGVKYDREAGGYVPTDAEQTEGIAAQKAFKGQIFPLILAYYDPETDTLYYRPHPEDKE